MQLIKVLFDSCTRRGLIVDVANVLVESHCSCGMMRQDRHMVTTEPAALCTHHSTAPTLKG